MILISETEKGPNKIGFLALRPVTPVEREKYFDEVDLASNQILEFRPLFKKRAS